MNELLNTHLSCLCFCSMIAWISLLFKWLLWPDIFLLWYMAETNNIWSNWIEQICIGHACRRLLNHADLTFWVRPCWYFKSTFSYCLAFSTICHKLRESFQLNSSNLLPPLRMALHTTMKQVEGICRECTRGYVQVLNVQTVFTSGV